MTVLRVMVVDDHAVVRNGLRMLLEAAGGFDVVHLAEDGRRAVDLAADDPPDVVLMDLAMPVMDGVEATRALKAAHPGVRVVVLTSLGEPDRIVAAIDAGADGYLFKHAEPAEIAEAIRTAHEGGAVLDPKAARAMLDARSAPSGPALTDREQQVLDLVAEGLANKQIGRRLGITERTVKAHLTRIYQAIGVQDRTQAALWVQRRRG
ncbi:response regulator [Euzebya rosea]|uniref:response regulator n=1 Tax=Euzebya rosea TaxID=2052804 RepID=UPI00196AC996|nr:response regulator transcription factor [Euzebya rosea]